MRAEDLEFVNLDNSSGAPKFEHELERDDESVLDLLELMPSSSARTSAPTEPQIYAISRPVQRPQVSTSNAQPHGNRIRARNLTVPGVIQRLDQRIMQCSEIGGSLLRLLREEAGVSMEQIQVGTKIPRKYIESLESQEYVGLPAHVYVRGFVDTYMRYLGLNRKDVIDAIMKHYIDNKK